MKQYGAKETGTYLLQRIGVIIWDSFLCEQKTKKKMGEEQTRNWGRGWSKRESCRERKGERQQEDFLKKKKKGCSSNKARLKVKD